MSEKFKDIFAGYPKTPFLMVTAGGKLTSVQAIVYDPDVGTLCEMQWPDGSITYGYHGNTKDFG